MQQNMQVQQMKNQPKMMQHPAARPSHESGHSKLEPLTAEQLQNMTDDQVKNEVRLRQQNGATPEELQQLGQLYSKTKQA